MEEHLVEKFMGLGCKNRRDANIALMVYLNLCEVKRFWNVTYHFNETLKVGFLTGSETKTSQPKFFLPIANSDSVTFTQLTQYFTLSKGKCITLAIVAEDSTCIYYNLEEGICDPNENTPLGRQERSYKEQKSAKIDEELAKNRVLIEHAALCGTTVKIHPEGKPNGPESATSSKNE